MPYHELVTRKSIGHIVGAYEIGLAMHNVELDIIMTCIYNLVGEQLCTYMEDGHDYDIFDYKAFSSYDLMGDIDIKISGYVVPRVFMNV